MRKGIVAAALYGMAAGFVATLIMEVFAALAMILMGSSMTVLFEFIGRVVVASASRLQIHLAGFFTWGIIAYYLLGIFFGALFSMFTPAIRRPRLDTLGKSTIAGSLYMVVLSQPLVLLAPLALTMPDSAMLGWYGLTTVMHAIYGAVLGIAQYYRATILRRRSKFSAA